jgi:alpha-glucosidase
MSFDSGSIEGVDGFRLDAINWLGKDTRWPNNPFRLGLRGYTRQHHLYDRDQALAHEQLCGSCGKSFRRTPDAVLIGEAAADTPGGPASFYGKGDDELHLVFDFRLMKSPWCAKELPSVPVTTRPVLSTGRLADDRNEQS